MSAAADGLVTAAFDAPVLPDYVGEAPDATTLAAILGLQAGDIGFGAHRPVRFKAPGTFCFVAVKTRAALDRIVVDAKALSAALSALGEARPAVYAYAPDAENPRHAFSTRMFAPGLGIGEDPATGSAATALAGVIMRFAPPADGRRELVLEQGFAMGRPSLITLGLDVAGGVLKRVTIAGSAVILQRGELFA